MCSEALPAPQHQLQVRATTASRLLPATLLLNSRKSVLLCLHPLLKVQRSSPLSTNPLTLIWPSARNLMVLLLFQMIRQPNLLMTTKRDLSKKGADLARRRESLWTTPRTLFTRLSSFRVNRVEWEERSPMPSLCWEMGRKSRSRASVLESRKLSAWLKSWRSDLECYIRRLSLSPRSGRSPNIEKIKRESLSILESWSSYQGNRSLTSCQVDIRSQSPLNLVRLNSMLIRN